MTNKKIVYIDMDGVLVDLVGWIKDNYLPEYIEAAGIGNIVDNNAVAFYEAAPIKGAVEAFIELCKNPELEVFILSTAPWANSESWKAKRVWVEEHLGPYATKKLILSHRKDLLRGDILIDDRPNNGAAEFEGELIKFGTKPFESWEEVLNHIKAI